MNNHPTPAIRLRALEPADAAIMFDADNSSEAWSGADSPAPYSMHLLREYALNYEADPFAAGQLRLIAETADTGEVVGILDFYDISLLHSHAWVGIIVLPHLRHRGYGAAMLAEGEDYARRKLRLSRLGAKIIDANLPSQKLFAAAGYQKCGQLPHWHFSEGRFHNLLLFSLPLE